VKYYYLRLEDIKYNVEYDNPLDILGPSDIAAKYALEIVWKNMIRATGP
jgi:hypothetical protein